MGTWAPSAIPPGEEISTLVHDFAERSLSAMPSVQQRLKIFASATMKPDRVVESRGRSGMGSNTAWQRRHNDGVD